MDKIAPFISNLVKTQFPQYYQEHGPFFVEFVTTYFKWLEEKSLARNEFFNPKRQTVSVSSQSSNIIGNNTTFTTDFVNSDYIAVCTNNQTDDYRLFQVNVVANDSLLTIKNGVVPGFTHANTKFATVDEKPNANFLTRNYFTIHDIDETFEEYILFFKEKYLANLQFTTVADTRTLVKHSLDLYRSKGTERSIDLLYKVVFGKPAKVYYPGQDLFRLSQGDWHIPKYLELSLAPENRSFIGQQILGTLSGATAFVEEIIRRVSGNKITEIAYISAINGSFRYGEKVTLSASTLDLNRCPHIVGSLNELEMSVSGSGLGFELNELIDIESLNGRGAKGKVTGISNSSGTVLFDLLDGGYGYTANTTLTMIPGTVTVNTSCTVVIGVGTAFETAFVNGDVVGIYYDGANYEIRQIDTISSDTQLTINSAFGFDATDTYIGLARDFAQTFISEKILTLSNVQIDNTFSNFEYVTFKHGITQPMALVNYENISGGEFAAGDGVFTYWPNNAVKGQGRIMENDPVGTGGTLTIAVISGDLNEPAIYNDANAVTANLAVANGYTDISATANVIGNYGNVVLSVNGMVGTFANGEEIFNETTEARGFITQISNNVIFVANTQGIFHNNTSFLGLTSGATATVNTLSINLGVIYINNTFTSDEHNYVNTAFINATVTSVSLGSGAAVVFSNELIYTEVVDSIIDIIWQHLDDQLDDTWVFSGVPNANLTTPIEDALSNQQITVGRVSSILATSPGVDYNKPPIVRLHEPLFFTTNRPDTLVLEMDDVVGFDVGEIITQAATGGRGLIEAMNIEEDLLYVQVLRLFPNNDFVSTSNSTTVVEGADTGFTANIMDIEVRTQSPRLGSDVLLDYDLVLGTGAITNVKITDSGVGFANGETVTITSQEDADKTANGFAVLLTHGTGTGYYRDQGGFLSDTQILSDGFYWQEYSYEVRSSVISNFKDNLRTLVHVAGTKYFDALYYDTINSIEPNVESTSAVHTPVDNLVLNDGSNLLLGDGTSYLLLIGSV